MKAVIIAGGKGIRLGNLTKKIPKPMLKIGDKTILEHQIDLLKRYKIIEIIVCAGYLSEVIEEFITNSNRSTNIRYSIESKPLGTAGCIKELEATLNEDFLVLYGDIMLDMNIDYLISYHFSKKSVATLVAHPNDHPYDSDLLEVDSNNKIVNFLNKPHKNEVFYRNLVNAGIYVLSNTVFNYIQNDKTQDFAKDVFPYMLKNEERIFAYNTPEYIKDIGTKDRIESVRKDFCSGKINRLNLANKRAAIFTDRDGVINKEVNLLSRTGDFGLLPGITEAIKNINKTEYLTVVVTNQPVVAKGLCSIEDVKEIHKKMETLLGKDQAKIDAIYFCPHHPEKGFPGENIKYKIDCSCRKPKIGMIEKAQTDLNIDLKESLLIGDRTVDIQTAKNAGLTSIGVRSGYGCKDGKYYVEPTYWADDLNDAVNIIRSLKIYNNLNKDILAKIKESHRRKYIIAIGGVSRSGKSIFANNLKSFLIRHNLNTKIINMDNWIIPLDKRKDKQNIIDRFQIHKFESDFEKILKGKKIKLKKYVPLKRGTGRNFITYSAEDFDIIIVCGVCSLNSLFISEIANLKIYVGIKDKVYKNRFYNFYKWKGLDNKNIELLYNKRLIDETSIIKKGKKNAYLTIRGDYYDY